MKTKGIILLGALSLAFLAACQDDDNENVIANQGNLGNVTFEIDASSIQSSVATRTIVPTYTKDGFSIYAYKKTGDNYIFNKTISLANMSYRADTKKLVGTDNLEIGTYRFVPAYGVNAGVDAGILTAPDWQGSFLSDDLNLTFNGYGLLNEVFLDIDNTASSLTSYDFAITEAANQTVTATLKRAVSRVDVMFISATKVGNEFVEKEYHDASSNIFGGKTIEQFQLRFTGINNVMNMFGVNKTNTPINRNFNLINLDQAVVFGTGTSTAVGGQEYTGYDNIQQADIIRGSAHVFGTYLFPSETASANLTLYIKPEVGDARTITIVDSNKAPLAIPVERNKVTLVKIYVLNDNNVFSTTVDFEVEIDTVWEDPNEVSGSIS